MCRNPHKNYSEERSTGMEHNQTTMHFCDSDTRKWARVLLLGRLSFKLARILNSYGLKLAYNLISLGICYHLTNKIAPKKESSENIYSITCECCPPVHIGQIGCSLQTRFSEYKRAILRDTTTIPI